MAAGLQRRTLEEPGLVAQELALEVRAGQAVTVEKVVALFTSRDRAIAEPGDAARGLVARLPDGFDELLERHTLAWDQLWRRCRIDLGGDGDPEVARALNLHVFHLLQTVSEHTIDLDAGVPARGLHGEAYRGHIFWDELFIFPFLNLRFPELTRALLRYRARRLPEARQAARAAGLQGAMYPWQSGSDGREETQRLHLNPRSGRWLPDRSHRQRHVNAAVAWNVWQYYQATGDLAFLEADGAEMLVEIARFWASSATYNRALETLELLGDHRRVELAERTRAGPGGAGRTGRRSAASCASPSTTATSSASSRATATWRSWTGTVSEPATATSGGWTGSWRPRATPPTATRPPSRPTC